MEQSIWLIPSFFKQNNLSTSHGGTELKLTEGRFSRIPFKTRWLGWFLSDIEPNYSWKLVMNQLQKQFERLPIESLDLKSLECVRQNLQKTLEISKEYQKMFLLNVLSRFSDDYFIDTEWVEKGIASIDEQIEKTTLQMKKKEIITNLINSFSQEDIEVPGIFRVSSSKADVERWSKALLNNPKGDISTLNPLLRATLLKSFLKKLVLFKQDENFIAAGNTEENQWERLNRLMLAVQNLPEDNRQILQVVLPLLKKVADYKENNINAKNLGICMGQDMLSLEDDDDLKHLSYSNEALSLLIENQEKVL